MIIGAPVIISLSSLRQSAGKLAEMVTGIKWILIFRKVNFYKVDARLVLARFPALLLTGLYEPG